VLRAANPIITRSFRAPEPLAPKVPGEPLISGDKV